MIWPLLADAAKTVAGDLWNEFWTDERKQKMADDMEVYLRRKLGTTDKDL